MAIQTDRKIKSNRPDIKRKTCLLIDMAIPTDNNITVKEYKKWVNTKK